MPWFRGSISHAISPDGTSALIHVGSPPEVPASFNIKVEQLPQLIAELKKIADAAATNKSQNTPVNLVRLDPYPAPTILKAVQQMSAGLAETGDYIVLDCQYSNAFPDAIAIELGMAANIAKSIIGIAEGSEKLPTRQ